VDERLCGRFRSQRGHQVLPLKPKTLAVLCYLVERPGQLVTKEDLLGALWAGVYVGDAVLKTCVRELHQFLEQQLERVSPEQRQVLEAASVAGRHGGGPLPLPSRLVPGDALRPTDSRAAHGVTSVHR
jgi:hypothetical protein